MSVFMPKVAIYMPCYNHEKFVGQAVDSVLNQTYSNLELFIVNDGSTDRSGEILESYKDERLHYFKFERNTKYVGASNFLQDLIEGLDFDYISDIASDDMWEEDKLEKQVNFLMSHPEYKACFTWDKIVYSADRPEYQANGDYSHKENGNRFDWMRHFFYFGNCINACSMLMDKKVFYEIGRMNGNYIQLADYRAWMHLVDRYPFYLMKEELTIYRRHETNLSNASIATFIRSDHEEYRIFSEILKPMTKENFRRTFYRELAYVRCETEEELLAEKFIILIKNMGRINTRTQVAMDIYFEYCDNKEFVSTLEDKYSFCANDFIHLTGNAGLAFSINEWTEQDVISQQRENIKSCSPGVILLEAIDRQKLNHYTISEYRYTTLLDLYRQTRTYEGGDAQFIRIRQLVGGLRVAPDSRTRRKVLFIIAENSQWDVKNFRQELNTAVESDVCIAYVPEMESAFTEQFVPPIASGFLEEVQDVDLYDKEEHCLRFFDELEGIDVIYYVDCLGSDYECENMLAAGSLSVEYNCILHKNLYEKLVQDGTESLGVMNLIKVYE